MSWLLHNIAPCPQYKAEVCANYNTREQVEKTDGVITFDGVYFNVYENKDLLVGREVILFVMGDYVGKDNSFDVGMPREDYCSWDEIVELAKQGCKIGWHTRSHRDLTTIEDEDELVKEIKPPFPMDYFAYPYGRWNDRVIQIVKKYYKKAYAVDRTDGTEYTLLRSYVR